MSPRLLASMVVLLAAVAGCISTPPDDATTASTGSTTDASLLVPITDTVDGDVMLSAATPARTLNYGGAFATILTTTDNATGYVLELEWTAATPASEQLSLWVRPSGQGALPPDDPTELVTISEPLAKASGPSPLRLVLSIDQFPELGDYDILVRADAAPVGAAANQPYTLHVTRFEGIPFDDAFSALGAAPEEG